MRLIEEVKVKGIVSFKLFSREKKLIHDQTINNLVTDLGSNFLANRLIKDDTRYVQYIGLGEGSTPPAKTDIDLEDAFEYEEIINQIVENSSVSSFSTTFSEDPNSQESVTIREVGLFSNFDNSNNRILISRAVLNNSFIKSPTDFLIVNWKIKIG